MKRFYLLLNVLLVLPELWASQLPAALIYYERPGATVFIVDKSGCAIHVFQYQGHWNKVREFACTTGKLNGEKDREGDLKTPTGLYQMSKVWTGEQLFRRHGSSASIYGVGAFELNYPNYLDKVWYQKDGDGIWLHGTDKPQPEATRGCIATTNENWSALAQFIELRQTPFIVEETMTYLPEETIVQVRRELLKFIEEWRSAWESNPTERYLTFYSERFKTPEFDYPQWSRFKQRINQRNQNRRVTVEELSIFQAKGIYHIAFIQRYDSSRTKSRGKKYVYVVQEQGRYQIISERWEKVSPSARQYVNQVEAKEAL